MCLTSEHTAYDILFCRTRFSQTFFVCEFCAEALGSLPALRRNLASHAPHPHPSHPHEGEETQEGEGRKREMWRGVTKWDRPRRRRSSTSNRRKSRRGEEERGMVRLLGR